MSVTELSERRVLPPPVAGPALGLPDCQFCAEEIADGHPEWEADAGSIRYGGDIYCGFHAYAFLGSRPASTFNAMGVDC